MTSNGDLNDDQNNHDDHFSSQSCSPIINHTQSESCCLPYPLETF